MMDQPTLGPVRESDRILALDAARGFALLGIFLVNIGSFGEAFGHFVEPAPRADRGQLEWLWWTLGKALWEGRFYPLFSLLFGIGLAIQFQRARLAGRRFAPTAIRRLLILAFIGVLHAVLLWYGDILFIYGMVGLIMVALVRLSARTLFIIAGSLIAFTASVTLAAGLIPILLAGAAPNKEVTISSAREQEVASIEPMSATPPATADDALPGTAVAGETPRVEQSAQSPAAILLQEIRHLQGPGDPRWIALETTAYRDGPWLDSLGFRALTWGFFIGFALFSFAWHVLAMFCIGAGLYKSGIFHASRRGWLRKFVVVGFVFALPASLVAAWLMPTVGIGFSLLGISVAQLILGPLMSLGYFGAITLMAQRPMAPRALEVLAAAGRMAFTNYLMQTVLATAIFYHWGLGWFESTTRLERIGIVLGIYAFQLGFSVLWLKGFQMGPLEWLWRAATYMRFPPIRRTTRVR